MNNVDGRQGPGHETADQQQASSPSPSPLTFLVHKRPPVTIQDWFQRPILTSTYGLSEGQSIPRADLQAARPPAVNLWEKFCNQAKVYFDSITWPEVEIPDAWNEEVEYQHPGIGISIEKAAERILRLYDYACTPFKTQFAFEQKASGLMIQQGDKDVLSVMTFDYEDYTDLSKFDEYFQESENATCIQRLVERIYGHLIWTATCLRYLHHCMQHEAKDLTAKQALTYVLDLASKQAPFDMLAKLGPRKPDTKSREDLLRMFKGMENVQFLRIDDIKLGELLGKGYGGAVYDATVNGVPMALKVAHVGGAHDTDTTYFKSPSYGIVQEAKAYEALNELQGSVIPKLHAYGVLENRVGNYLPFIAMEKINGATLDQTVPKQSTAQMHDAFKAVIVAYIKLHAQDYNHGDVNGANVMIRLDGNAVIIDLEKVKRTADTALISRDEKSAVQSMLQRLLESKMYAEAERIVSQYAEELSREAARAHVCCQPMADAGRMSPRI